MERAGEILMKEKKRDNPTEWRAYKCQWCGGWHLTKET